MNYRKQPPIDVNNGFDVLAVWEKRGKKWHLLMLARPKQAVELLDEQPKTRLLLQSNVDPNELAKKQRQQTTRKNLNKATKAKK